MLETRMKNLEETQDKTVIDKEDLSNITTEISQQKVEKGIKTLTGDISALKSITAKHSDVLRLISIFFDVMENAPNSPQPFVKQFNYIFNQVSNHMQNSESVSMIKCTVPQ